MGLLVIFYVSVEMIYEGYHEVRYGREETHVEEVPETPDEEIGTGAEADLTKRLQSLIRPTGPGAASTQLEPCCERCDRAGLRQ